MTRGRLTPLQTTVLDEFFAHERGFFLTGGGALVKVPAGYNVEQLRRFKDELAERMAIATHPT